MIRKIARCPYCDCVIRLHKHPPAVLLSPARTQQPCPHLALLHVALEVYDYRHSDPDYVLQRSGTWLFEFGRGLWSYRPDEDEPLYGLILDIAFDHLEEGKEAISTEYQVCGGDADQREGVVPGAGYYHISLADGEQLQAELHGWAVYSRTPAALVKEVQRLLSA